MRKGTLPTDPKCTNVSRDLPVLIFLIKIVFFLSGLWF